MVPKRNAEPTRDDLISQAQYGKITPDQAEAEAAARGWPPFATKPALPAFDAMQEPRWSIVMAIAWIAWRDVELVREQSPGFASESAHWIWRQWNEPIKSGTAFTPRKGWFLETWHEATTVRLGMLEAVMKSREELPASCKMSVRQAEKSLWKALLEARLIAEALNKDGIPVDVPQREWSYLKLFEDGKRDVLKYAPLDRLEPYSQVKLKRDDLLKLWPQTSRYAPDPQPSEWPVTANMLKPLSDPGNSGFVPLCSALQWIMTGGGSRDMILNDPTWAEAVQKLWPLICGEEIELIGLPAGQPKTERLTGHALAVVKVLSPLHNAIDDILLHAPSHVVCIPFVDHEHWLRDFNDSLYESGRAKPAWTHLQVRKSDILARWARPSAKSKAGEDCYRWLLDIMQSSPIKKTATRTELWSVAKKQFRGLTERQYNRCWDRAVGESGATSWSRSGPIKRRT